MNSRAARFVPLLAVVLFGADLYAQRGWSRGGGLAGGAGTLEGGAGGPRTSGAGRGAIGLGTHTRHQRGRRFGDGVGFVDPFWYAGGYYGGYYDEPTVIEREIPVPALPPAPPQVAPEPQRIPTPPKMTEIPAARKAESSSRPSAAIFVLSNGERIETRHYLLTANSVQLTVERKRRSIPLEALDLRATVAANRERGLDLQIPTGGSEVVLGF